MTHWRRVLPAPTILDVRSRTWSPISKSRRAASSNIAACPGTTAACLHETERPVRTASATQVRQPIYKSAVGRRRVYEAQLDPLLRALGIAETVAG